jgi:hypothetical protein
MNEYTKQHTLNKDRMIVIKKKKIVTLVPGAGVQI